MGGWRVEWRRAEQQSIMRLRQGSLSSSGGSIELSPLIIEDRGLMLPFGPSPGHWMQLVDVLPQVGVECLLEVVDQSNVP